MNPTVLSAHDAHSASKPDLRLVIRYEPDGFSVKAPRLMGRQAAGDSFLRAAARAAQEGELACLSPSKHSFEEFQAAVHAVSPSARASWIDPRRMANIGAFGTLYCPDANIHAFAASRLRTAPDAWSIMGVTHTTASAGAINLIGSLITAPVMPWDALICTSRSVLKTVETVLGDAAEQLAWRLGSRPESWMPRLPVIPLGIHTGDFDFDPDQKQAARHALAIEEDETVVLFVGRLSFHAKAHPHAMYRALETVAQRTGRKIVLVQCGWFANDFIGNAFRDGAKRFAPSVRHLFTEGRDPEERQRSWAAGDIFMSLSDNVQETFGLVPIEAMAAGLPVIVSDWDGYRELVRDGVDGFRIPTFQPDAGHGRELAEDYETLAITYDQYCGFASQSVALDHDALASACEALVLDPERRARMGAAGRTSVRETYDWTIILARYRRLMEDLSAIRRSARSHPAFAPILARAPSAPWAAPDPFRVFAHYPTRRLTADMRVEAADRAIDLEACVLHPLFMVADRHKLMAIAEIVATHRDAPMTPRILAQHSGLALATVMRVVAQLMKIGSIKASDSYGVPSDVI